MTRARGEAGLALVLALAGVALAGWASSRVAGARFAPYFAAHGLVLLASLVARRAVMRADDPRAALRALLGLAVALRLVLIPVAPFTTTDVGRYLWDGAVALRGLDPYALPPASPILDALRQRVPAPVDHLEVATCYPPMALALFALAAACGAYAWLAWKALCVTASCLTAWLVARACAREARPGDAALVLLGPLAIFETSLGAHLDAFVAFGVVAMVLAARRDRWNLAALAAGGVIALKLVPGVIALPLLVRAPRRTWFAALAAAPLALSFGVAELLGLTHPGSLPVVARHWSFGSPLWSALYARHPFHSEEIRAAMLLGGITLVTLISLQHKPIERTVTAAAGASLFASPVLYPWYGSSIAALLGLRPRAWALAALAVVPLSYEVIDGFHARGVWSPASWPEAALVLATLLGLAWDAREDRRAR